MDQSKVSFNVSCRATQLVHDSLFQTDSVFITWFSVLTYLEGRKKLWEDIMGLTSGIQAEWMVAGDSNNVLCTEDRIGGPRCINFKTFKI